MCVSTTPLSIIDTKAIIPMANNEDSNNYPFVFCKVNIRTERNITGYLQADRNCNVQFYHAELGLINIVGGGGTHLDG